MLVSAPIEFERWQLRRIEWLIVLRVAVFLRLSKRTVLDRAALIARLVLGRRILPRRLRTVRKFAR